MNTTGAWLFNHSGVQTVAIGSDMNPLTVIRHAVTAMPATITQTLPSTVALAASVSEGAADPLG